jgi:hypothetical protein
MASGTIIVANATNVPMLSYAVGAIGGPAGGLCSGVLGNVVSGSPASGYPAEQKCAVSGYDQYYVSFSYIGADPATSSYVTCDANARVALAVQID